MMQVGQTVILKSGGPIMVVTAASDVGGVQKLDVMWFAKNNGRSQFNTAQNLPAPAFTDAAELLISGNVAAGTPGLIDYADKIKLKSVKVPE